VEIFHEWNRKDVSQLYTVKKKLWENPGPKKVTKNRLPEAR
jgi:hypothetical protein